MNTIVKDLFKDIDLYDDQIELLQARFPSPIGSTAISFYHFYIDDTVKVGATSAYASSSCPQTSKTSASVANCTC